MSFIFLVRNVPYIFFTAFDESFFNERVLRYFNNYANIALDWAFLKYAFVQTVAFISLLAGIYYGSSSFKPSLDYSRSLNIDRKPLFLSVFICSLIALAGYVSFVKSLGGIQVLLTNLHDRVALQSGQHGLKLRPLLGMSTVFLLILQKDKKSFFGYLLIICWVCLTIFVFSSTGAERILFI